MKQHVSLLEMYMKNHMNFSISCRGMKARVSCVHFQAVKQSRNCYFPKCGKQQIIGMNFVVSKTETNLVLH